MYLPASFDDELLHPVHTFDAPFGYVEGLAGFGILEALLKPSQLANGLVRVEGAYVVEVGRKAHRDLAYFGLLLGAYAGLLSPTGLLSLASLLGLALLLGLDPAFLGQALGLVKKRAQLLLGLADRLRQRVHRVGGLVEGRGGRGQAAVKPDYDRGSRDRGGIDRRLRRLVGDGLRNRLGPGCDLVDLVGRGGSKPVGRAHGRQGQEDLPRLGGQTLQFPGRQWDDVLLDRSIVGFAISVGVRRDLLLLAAGGLRPIRHRIRGAFGGGIAFGGLGLLRVAAGLLIDRFEQYPLRPLGTYLCLDGGKRLRHDPVRLRHEGDGGFVAKAYGVRAQGLELRKSGVTRLDLGRVVAECLFCLRMEMVEDPADAQDDEQHDDSAGDHATGEDLLAGGRPLLAAAALLGCRVSLGHVGDRTRYALRCMPSGRRAGIDHAARNRDLRLRSVDGCLAGGNRGRIARAR